MSKEEAIKNESDAQSSLPTSVEIIPCKDCMYHETLRCITKSWTSQDFYCQYGDKKSDLTTDNVYISFQEILKLPRNVTYNFNREVVEETIDLKDIVSLLGDTDI